MFVLYLSLKFGFCGLFDLKLYFESASLKLSNTSTDLSNKLKGKKFSAAIYKI